MRNDFEFRIKSTFLSQRPRKEGSLIAAVSIQAILLVSLICWKDPQMFRLLAAVPQRVLVEHEYWRLITAIGVHADLRHFASNAVFFIFFSYLLYGYLGFWIYPVSILVLGSLTHYLALLTYADNIHLVGASGVVYLMAGFWLTFNVLVQRTRSLAKRLMQAIGIGLLVLVPTNLSPEVSYRTHLIGCTIGVMAAMGYFQSRKERIRSLETIEIEEF